MRSNSSNQFDSIHLIVLSHVKHHWSESNLIYYDTVLSSEVKSSQI